MLCTSGFVDDVIFFIMALSHVTCMAIEYDKHNSRDSRLQPTFAPRRLTPLSTHRKLRIEVEVCYP